MRVQHSGGAYDVLSSTLAEALCQVPHDSRIITDRTVAEIAKAELSDRQVFVIEPGEFSKSLEVFGEAVRWMAQTNASRKTTLVALGGGVVGDLAGFVAASYMRGVPFVQIPTTLLAMVDSSVGGKVAVDLPEGKNLVGAFKPPDAVLVPLDLLKALPERQFRNGMAEVLKTAFIMDAELAQALRANVLRADSPELPTVIVRCVELKAQVVAADEFETTGLRATLNFGHTIGHAIEQVRGYREILHGEAISIGMSLEAELGEHLGITPQGTSKVVREDLSRYGLPVDRLPNLGIPALLSAMSKDKKVVGGVLAFSLLTFVGGCKLVRDVPQDAVEAVLAGK